MVVRTEWQSGFLRAGLAATLLAALSCLGCPRAAVPPADPPATSGPADPAPPPRDPLPPPAVAAEKVTVLFDGKSLDNWKVTDFGIPSDVKVENGQLIIAPANPNTRLAGVSWTGKQLPKVNYEITAQAQRVEGGDFFIGVTFPVHETYCSLIVGGWGGNVVGLSNINEEDASENESNSQRQFETGKWYAIRVRVTEHQIQAWIDQDQVVNLDYSEKRISVRLEMELQYPLGLATYRTKGAIKDVQLRELRRDELPPPPQSE